MSIKYMYCKLFNQESLPELLGWVAQNNRVAQDNLPVSTGPSKTALCAISGSQSLALLLLLLVYPQRFMHSTEA
jgi:hypothetical protein